MEIRLRERSEARGSGTLLQSLRDPLLAALVTAAIYWLVMLLGDYVPFGINTPAVTDAKLQYLDLFAYYRDVLTGQNSAVYTFSNTLGGGAAAIWAYYLASPFNLLVLLFEKDRMNLFLEVLITVKLSAASAAFAWFIGRRFREKVRGGMTLLLSVSYGLMQYMTAQGSNVMWLDGVILLPFIVLGIHNAVSSRRFRLRELAVPAALSVLANWYTGGINYLFSAVWFLYEVLRGQGTADADSGPDERNDSGARRTSSAAGKYLAGMGTGLLLAAVLFLPNVIALREGKAGSWNPFAYAWPLGLRGNPLSVIRSYRIGEMSDISRASFFSGTLAAFGTAAYFYSDRVRAREKLAILVPGLTAWLACFWYPLFYVFSLFMRNTSYWYRFGYLGCFVLLYCAAYWCGSLPRKGGFRSRKRWAVIPKAGGTCLVLVLLSQKVWPQGGSGSTRAAIFMLLAVTAFMGYLYAPDRVLKVLEAPGSIAKHRKILAVLLVALGLWEAFLETRAILNIYHTDTAQEYAAYSREAQAQIEALKEYDRAGFYRVSQTAARITNIDGLTGAYLDAMAYRYASISGYTSCPENIQIEFLDRLGYRKEYDSFNIVNTSFLPADSLLSVRYILTPYGIPGLREVPELGSHNTKAVYINPYALPMALLPDSIGSGPEVTEEGDPFAFTEALYSSLSGEKANLWIRAEKEKSYERGITTWKLKVPAREGAGYCLYGNLPWLFEADYDDPKWWDDAQEQGRLTVADGWAFGYGGWLSPSVFYIPVSEDGTAQITLETDGEPKLRDEQFYALDLARFGQLTAKIREKTGAAVRDLLISNGKISCTVYAQEGQKLVLGVPASKGWSARVNGQKARIEDFEGCLVQIPLVPGENHIKMQYRVPGLGAGILLSAAGLGILAVWDMSGKKKDRKNSCSKGAEEREE